MTRSRLPGGTIRATCRKPVLQVPPGRRDLYPRIGNCYGAGLGHKKWEEGRDYWTKLGLVVGGCYDLHYDWENPRWPKVLKRAKENIERLRAANPHVLVLPYVDVIEGPDNPNVPKHWWDLNDCGERWSGWPGYLRVNTRLEEVLRFNLAGPSSPGRSGPACATPSKTRT